MCLILFAYQAHAKYKLMVAANRDEFYNRPTSSIHYWEDHPHILAGRDLEKMGTWMGVTRTGRFAALTNYRNPKEQTNGKRSRGELAADYLKCDTPPKLYLEEIAVKRDQYPGYNLLAGDVNELYYYSNIENKVSKLKPGIYGISNHLLNTEWPKVERGINGLTYILKGNGDLTEHMMTLLQDADPPADDMLPNTGVSIEWERILSTLYIKSDAYGTRSSTVLLMTDKEIHTKERTYSKQGSMDQEFVTTLG
jgi:uncharacterized protein with NRDE domain